MIGDGQMAVSIQKSRNLNYALSNKASFSDAYTKSVQKPQGTAAFPSIDGVAPVVYANKQVDGVMAAAKMKEAQEANQAYNDIAEQLSGSAGYSSSSQSYGYEMLGRNFDEYA